VNANEFELAKSLDTDKNYFVPKFNDKNYIRDIEKIIEYEKIDFMIPNHEFEIQRIAHSDSKIIKSKCLIPRKETIDLCVDKFKLIDFLYQRGFNNNVPKSINAISWDDVYSIENFPVWLRLTKGAGSQGAFLAHDTEEVVFWIKYWLKHKSVDLNDFMISEYLPGDDHHHWGLWYDGRVVLAKTIKRLKYCCGKYTLTGTSSSPSLCVAVKSREIDELANEIISLVDPKATGLFGIDFKKSENGNHCLTEINIGRFPRINYIFNLEPNKTNIAEYYVKAGMKMAFKFPSMDFEYEDFTYLIRDFDTAPVLKTFDEIYDIHDINQKK
jgi:carbamoyl-phosphate synthase large subunit